MNIKRFLIAAVLSTVIAGMLLGGLGHKIGIPSSWNSFLVGGIGGAVGAFFGLYPFPNKSGDNEAEK